MTDYTGPSGHVFDVPPYTGSPPSADDFRRFADSFPKIGTIPIQKKSVVEYQVVRDDMDTVIVTDVNGVYHMPNDGDIPVGSVFAVANIGASGVVEIRPQLGQVVEEEPQRFLKVGEVGTLVKIHSNFWLLSLGQGGSSAYSPGAPDAPTVSAVTDYSWSWNEVSGSSGVAIQYGADVSPDTVTYSIDQTNRVITFTGADAGVQVTFSIYGVNNDGRGLGSDDVVATLPSFNRMTGGSETDVTNWNGSGHTYRLHTFTSSGTLVVGYQATNTEHLLIAGGGGGRGQLGNNAQGCVGGSGGAGGVIWSGNSGYVSIPVGSHSISVGGGGGHGGRGGNTTAFGLTAQGGGQGGSEGGGSGGSGGSGRNYCGNWGGPFGGGGGTAYQGHAGATGSGSQGSGSSGGGANVYESGTGHKTGGRGVSIFGSNQTVSPGYNGWGNPGSGRGWDAAGTSGSGGVCVVAYRIA